MTRATHFSAAQVPEMADDPTAFPALDPGQIAPLDGRGTRGAVAERDYLYREADAGYDFFVVSGADDTVTGSGGTEELIARHGSRSDRSTSTWHSPPEPRRA